MTYIPPGITYPEIQKIADERDQARVAELEAAMERIIAGPYAGQFASAADVAVEALKR